MRFLCAITADNGRRVAVQTDDDNVSPTQLRKEVSAATKIPLSQLRLIFRGRMIKDDVSVKAVEEYKLDPDCVLHCMGKQAEGTGADTAHGTSAAVAVAAPATPAAITPALAAAPAPSFSSVAPLKDPLQSALEKLRASNPPAVYSTAVTTLDKLLRNIVQNPMEEKYRLVKQGNAAFQKRLGGLPGGHSAMLAVGFTLQDAVYQLPASPEAWPRLLEAQTLVHQAATEAKAATGAVPPAVGGLPSTNAAGFGSGMPNLGVGAGGMPNMDDPMMQSAMANIMSNPDALRNMLQNPAIQQRLQSDPNVPPMMRQTIQQLAQNPAMLDQMATMMQDPQMRAQMQNMMSNGGAGGMGMDNMAAMAAMSNIANTNNTSSPARNSANNNTGNDGGNDQAQTEEEMIAEALRRSLEEGG